MRTLMLTGAKQSQVQDIAEPSCGADEVLVRVHAGAVCGSDMSAYKGTHFLRKPPMILGHEVAGEVIETGVEVDGLAPGERVTIDPQVTCGECRYCTGGQQTLCRSKKWAGVEIPGLFSEVVAMPAQCIYPLGGGIDWEQGSMVEPTAVATRAVEHADLADGECVLVLGAGPIGGLLALICAHQRQLNGLVVDIKPQNLEVVGTASGFRTAIAGSAEIEEIADELTEGDLFDTVFVANGANSSLAEATALCRPEGLIVALSATYPEPPPLDFSAIVVKELEVRGTVAYNPEDYRHAIAMIEAGLDVGSLVTDRAPLADSPQLFERILAGECGVQAVVEL